MASARGLNEESSSSDSDIFDERDLARLNPRQWAARFAGVEIAYSDDGARFTMNILYGLRIMHMVIDNDPRMSKLVPCH